VPANSLLKRNAQIQLASNLDVVERSEDGIKILKTLTEQDPKDIEAIMALGNIERGKKKFAECGDTYTLGIDALPTINDQSWVFFYFRGILLRAFEAVVEGRGRPEEGARAETRAAACAELPRLLVGRPGPQPRRRHEDDPPRGSSNGRTTATSSTRWAGPTSHRQLRGSHQEPLSARSSCGLRIRPSTTTWATPIGRSAASSRRNSSGRMRAT